MDRGTLRVSTRSWHGRIYNFWRQNAMFKRDNYTENLCHYVRVVLFWGPLSWFVHGRVTKHRIAPLVILVVLGMVTALVLGFIFAPMNTLTVLLFALLMGACFSGMGFTLYWADAHPDKVAKFGNNLWRVVSIPFRPVGWLFRKLQHEIGGLPAWAYVVGVLGLAPFLFAPIEYLKIWAFVLMIAVGALSVTGCMYLKERIQRWRRARKSRPTVEKDEGGLSVAWRFAVAKKHKICPLIEVERDSRGVNQPPAWDWDY